MARTLFRPAVLVGLLTIAGLVAAILLASRAPAGTLPGDRLILSNPNARTITDEPDGGGVLSKITVRASGRIRDLDVAVRIAHNSDEDLNIYLVSPSGRFVELSTDNGGNGNDYGAGTNSCAGQRTIFSDEGGTRIQDGAPPFLGAFIPQTPLSRLDGKPVRGAWRLQIFDDNAGDTGVLGCWQFRVKLGD
ncbi:MAG: proprotein convertase P-domain-containing protein [Actinomycetota bacterium]